MKKLKTQRFNKLTHVTREFPSGQKIRITYDLRDWDYGQVSTEVIGCFTSLIDLLEHYGRDKMKARETIKGALDMYFDVMWYQRHKALEQDGGLTDSPPDILEGALTSAERVEQELPAHLLEPMTDYEWGEVCGIRKALEWVLGRHLDFDNPGVLDT